MILEIIIGLCISYTLLFLLSIVLKDNSIADVFWGLGFLQVGVHSFYLSGTLQLSQIVFNVLILLWSLRIFLYIISKKWVKKGEDSRYQKWRQEWKFFYLRSFFQVYILQGVLLFIVATPIILVNFSSPSLGMVSILAVFISLFGLVYETIGDLQLRAFVKNKKPGQIMTKGLWKYSRHPNYFGESLFWLGMSIFAVQVSVISFVSWILITILLRFVSGVPMAEARYKENKDFLKYKKKTPAMIPNPFLK
jgi:steroid 5-alpha reductase family enzyme